MRLKTILMLVLISAIASSQTTKQPKWFLNGNEIDFDNVFLLPDNIENIQVKKNEPNGEIYVTTKVQPWKYKTVNELLETTSVYSKIKNTNPIILIDGKLIKKRSAVKIDDAYYAKVTLNSLSEIDGIKKNCKNLSFVDIKLTINDPKKEIIIRGTNSSIDSLLNLKK